MSWTPPADDPERELRDLLPSTGWRVAVAEIAARHGLGGELAPCATGSDVVWTAGDAVVKLTAPRWRWQIEAEARTLAHVAGRLPVDTPRPLATGELGGWPYVVTTRLPGVALGDVWPRIDAAERRRLAGELGALVRALHGLDTAGLPETWDAFVRECRATRAERHAAGGVPPALAAEVEPFLARVGPLADRPRVLLHTEVLDQHVLVGGRAGRPALSGLIDFADARVGPAEYEVPAPVEFLFRGEPGVLGSFLRAYGYAADELDAACSERLCAWGLVHRYGRLARMLAAVAPARPATLGELARRLYALG